MLTRTLTLAFCLFFIGNLQAQLASNSSHISTTEFVAKRLNNAINAPVSDFAPVKYGGRIYFSSMRKSTPGSLPVSRIFSCMPGETPTVDLEFNPKKTTKHIAYPVLMPDASRMFFTICSDESMQKCEIWYRDRAFEGNWGPAEKLPESINMRGTNNTQPTIGWDAPHKKYVLYFASNRAGGQGKMDIWGSAITWDGKFETPVCLPFNTPEDEVTPSFNQTSQVLYFSSNGLKGNGRFDVFFIKKTEKDTWAKPENMGKAFNTAYDDLFFTFHEPTQTGYLASDRPGSLCVGSAEGFNCFDIYEVKKTLRQTTSIELPNERKN